MDGLGPQEIRQLRGELTRAEFATRVGVNAHTIYRWELPIGSEHGRRPRGKAVAKLRALAMRTPDPQIVPIASAIEHALDGSIGDGSGSETEMMLLRVISDRSASLAARALASTGLALIDLMYRADGRRALATLAPALAPEAPPSALAEVAAALAYSMPDGEMFDLGLVHAHAQRADELASGPDAPTIHALAANAVANAALLGGDDDLMMRALGRIDAIAGASLPRIASLFLDVLRSYGATIGGHTDAAIAMLDKILANPLTATCANLEARALAARAMRMLENLGDPLEALELARRAKRIGAGVGMVVGVHTALALRAETEALVRLCRLAEADEAFAEADRIFDELHFPVTIVIPVQIRYLMVMARADALDSLSARLADVELPSVRAQCQAYSAWAAATAQFTRGTDPHATISAFRHAERLASGWGFLRRDLLTAFATAALVDGTLEEARAVLDRALRAAERRPSAWVSAHLRRAEGTLQIDEGRIDEGRTLLEASAAAFAASGDRLGAALARFGCAGVRKLVHAPDGEAKFAAATADLATIGLPYPQWIERSLDRAARAIQLASAPRPAMPPAVLTPTLELAMQRIAVAGAGVSMVMREIAAVVTELVGAPVVVEEDPATAPAESLIGTADPRVVAWFDIGGSRRHRLGLTQPIDDATRSSLRVLLVVAGLALQVASLRGIERPAPTSAAAVPDIPGLVAVSAGMRSLLADVARLAGSRATVLVSGESGAGKELIAHALHALSPRVKHPYVAFNCAAVPSELFEGQLFGYRKGAFTGASSDHPGVIRAADGGTLFLDEIGELPLDLQAKLLRFLDVGEVFPLGAQRPITVDVRVIAATNRDLAVEVNRGRFRQDLFYRLHVVPLMVPPLRDRKDDIAPLARHFARVIAGDSRPPSFAPDALVALRDRSWPGNVRELRNIIERAMAYAPSGVLTRSQLGV